MKKCNDDDDDGGGGGDAASSIVTIVAAIRRREPNDGRPNMTSVSRSTFPCIAFAKYAPLLSVEFN